MLQLRVYGTYRPVIQFEGWKEKQLKAKMLEAIDYKCAACGKGFDGPWDAQFHHRNPETKKFHLNHREMENKKLEDIQNEHKKGEWLHGACHKEAHKTNDPNRFDPEYLKSKVKERNEENKRLSNLRQRFGSLPPLLATRMEMWQNTTQPPLAAQQELADWVWELYDKDMLSVRLPEPLEADMVDVKNRKRWASPAGWEKVHEEWGEFKEEMPHAKVDAFEIDDKLDKPLDRNQWELLLGALQWPYMPIERFLQYSVLKLDGRLRHQKANEGIAKEQRKADLKQYETQAAKYVFDVVG